MTSGVLILGFIAPADAISIGSKTSKVVVRMVNLPKNSGVTLTITQTAPQVKGRSLYRTAVKASAILKNLKPGTYTFVLNKLSVKGVAGSYVGYLSTSDLDLAGGKTATVTVDFKKFESIYANLDVRLLDIEVPQRK